MFYINPKKFEGCKSIGRVNLENVQVYGVSSNDGTKIRFLLGDKPDLGWSFETEGDADNCLRAIDNTMEMINGMKLGIDPLAIRIKG